MYPLFYFTVSVQSYSGFDAGKYFGVYGVIPKVSVLWDPKHTEYYNKFYKQDVWKIWKNLWERFRRMQKEDDQFTFFFQKRKMRKWKSCGTRKGTHILL
jgi:hypothetical protein